MEHNFKFNTFVKVVINKRKIYNKLWLTGSKVELTRGERYKKEVLDMVKRES